MANSLKIWIIAFFFPPDFGGGATRSLNLARALQLGGHEVSVIASFPQYPYGEIPPRYRGKFIAYEVINGIKVIRLRVPQLPHKGFMNRLIIFNYFTLALMIFRSIFNRFLGSPHLIYSHTPVMFSSFVGYAYAKTMKALFMLDAPDIWPEELTIESPLLPFLKLIGRIMARTMYSMPNAITTVSMKAVKNISKNTKSKRIVAIPSGVDTNTFKVINKQEVRNILINRGLFPSELRDKFVVMYAGVIGPLQKLEVLVKAAEKLIETDITILVIGDGEEKNKIKGMIASLKRKNILLFAKQPRNMMPSILASADVCVLPLSKEVPLDFARPTKFFEYIACGKPLICSASGELSEIVRNNGIGVAVDPGNVEQLATAIKQIYKERNRLTEMEKKAAMLAESYSVNKVGTKLNSLIYDLLADK